MQERPVCFQCDKAIETNSDMVFEAPCGHEDCSSAVFHGICLFSWRERREAVLDFWKRMRASWLAEHGFEEEVDG